MRTSATACAIASWSADTTDAAHSVTWSVARSFSLARSLIFACCSVCRASASLARKMLKFQQMLMSERSLCAASCIEMASPAPVARPAWLELSSTRFIGLSVIVLIPALAC